MAHTEEFKSDETGPVNALLPEQNAPQPQLLRRNVSDDIAGLPAQALSPVPLHAEGGVSPEPASMMALVQDPFDSEVLSQTPSAGSATGIESSPQVPASQADLWTLQMQVRISRLKQNIHQLSDRLNRLEK